MRKTILAVLLLVLFTLTACDTTSDDNGDDAYVKDGNVINYFTMFGTETDCSDDWGSEGATCFDIVETYSDMTLTMRYYEILGSYYETFEFKATHGDAVLVTQFDYQVRHDTSIVYANNGLYIDGFLRFNGLDQQPAFELNTNYQYDITGDNAETEMQDMLNAVIAHAVTYYDDNIAGVIVEPEATS